MTDTTTSKARAASDSEVTQPGPTSPAPTSGHARAGAPLPAPVRAEKPPTHRERVAARRAGHHFARMASAETGAAALKAALDHLQANLKRLERADPARADRFRRDLAAQLHDIAGQIPAGRRTPR